MTSSEPAEIEPTSDTSPRRRRTRFLPRFGLRGLFVFALVFCLACAWAGRNYLALQREDAAIEALKATGARLHFDAERKLAHPATADATASLEIAEWNSTSNRILRTLGIWNPPPVRSIDFMGSQPPEDKALASLTTFPRLQRVGLAGDRLTGKSLAYLADHDELTSLEFFVTPGIGPDDLAGMPRSERITTLRLYSTYPHGATLIAGVGTLPEPRELHVYLSPLSHDEFAAIAAAPNLETLVLSGVTTSDAQAVRTLAKSPRLKSLRVQGCTFDDGDLLAIASIENLTELTLLGNSVSDDLLDRLASAPQLSLLEIEATTVEAVLAFSARRPACRVRHDGIDYLAGEAVEASPVEGPRPGP